MKQGNILAFSDYQANRIRRILYRKNIFYRESASFGYLSFLFNNQLLFALRGDNFEVRLHPDDGPETACTLPQHTSILIDKIDYYTEDKLEYWIDYAISPYLCTR